MVRVPLLTALLLLLAAALVVALVPAGLALDRRVSGEVRRAAVEDLGRAPMILEDRNAARAEALSMHAMTVAGTEGLAEALDAGRLEEASSIARGAASMYDEEPVVVGRDGASVVGPPVPAAFIDALRREGTRVDFVVDDGVPHVVGLMPVSIGNRFVGAAGSATAVDENLANALAALARADVTVLTPDAAVVASTLTADSAKALAAAVHSGRGTAATGKVRETIVDGAATWIALAPLGDAGVVVFSRTVDRELAALPSVRRGALLAGGLTLALALGVGLLVAATLTRPVRGLAEAADRVAQGDFESPVPSSRLEEIDRLGVAFRSMRETLRSRIVELAAANQALEDRQRRLHDLQAELIRQDRLASSARMAAELAHEIRNPVANVRNCLEVVRRALPPESEGVRFADMAIDELLRMHELAEHLLDLNRPAEAGAGEADAAEVASQVAALAGVGEHPVRVEVRWSAATRVAMPPDALKQILFNLVENAREAAGDRAPVTLRIAEDGAVVSLEVEDQGPGISEEALAQVFDPFFTTKDAVTGVGLGLFVAEGLARRYGGRIQASNRPDGGASFRVELPRGTSA